MTCLRTRPRETRPNRRANSQLGSYELRKGSAPIAGRQSPPGGGHTIHLHLGKSIRRIGVNKEDVHSGYYFSGSKTTQMNNPQYCDDLESALSGIILLGGHKAIEATQDFTKEMNEGNSGSGDPVIEGLRRSLRSELGLEQIALPKPHTLRMKP